MYSGTLSCNYGCLGFGDCQKACRFGAISIVDGKAVVDISKCTACTACVKACPKGLIQLVRQDKKVAKVVCSNKDKGAVARKVCEVACIGCGKCKKVCPSDAVTVENNLARIDPEKCTACGACVESCPAKCITFWLKVFKIKKILYKMKFVCYNRQASVVWRKIITVFWVFGASRFNAEFTNRLPGLRCKF